MLRFWVIFWSIYWNRSLTTLKAVNFFYAVWTNVICRFQMCNSFIYFKIEIICKNCTLIKWIIFYLSIPLYTKLKVVHGCVNCSRQPPNTQNMMFNLIGTLKTVDCSTCKSKVKKLKTLRTIIHTQQANKQTINKKWNFWLLCRQSPHGCIGTSFTERKAVIGRYDILRATGN